MTPGAVSIAAFAAMALGALLCDPPTIPRPRVPRIVRALAAYAGALVASGLSRLALWLVR